MPAHGKGQDGNGEHDAPFSGKPAPGAPSAAEDDDIEILEVVGVDEPEGAPEAGEEEPPGAPAAVDELAEATRDRDRYQELLLRARADFDNLQRRAARETEGLRTRAAADLVRHLLPVLDNLERALQSGAPPDDPMREGVALIHQQLLEVLTRAGLEPLDTLGQAFDPRLHEAVEVCSAEGFERGIILEEMLKGYRFKSELLRPALVKVAAGPRSQESGSDAGPAR